MSVRIAGKTITMTRGDTLNVKINILDKDGHEYIPADGDSIRFALKKDYSDPDPILEKNIPVKTLMLRLDSIDTKKLDQPENYVYDIQITLEDGTVDTFINGKLKTKQEVS